MNLEQINHVYAMMAITKVTLKLAVSVIIHARLVRMDQHRVIVLPAP